MLSRLSQNPALTRFGRRVGHFSKRSFLRLLDLVRPVPANLSLAEVRNVRRVLLVRPNFRIGNTLIASPLVLALRDRFPEAQLDYLAGDTTASLLEHLPIDQVYRVSRRFITRPWQFVRLFIALRRVGYDVAVEAGLGSFSGGLYAYLTGARYRIGCEGSADRFLNVRLPPVRVSHVYDSPPRFAQMLGVSCPDHPLYRVGAEERAAAIALLGTLGLVRGEHVLPFVALFVGGHQNKRWPANEWIELGTAIAAAGGRLVVFLGPEEVQLEDRLQRTLPSVRVLRPQPLRLFAALWSEAGLIVTPDSGPMHLAAALEVPIVALLQADASALYRPRGPDDRALFRATVAEATAAILAHPRWPRVVDAD